MKSWVSAASLATMCAVVAFGTGCSSAADASKSDPELRLEGRYDVKTLSAATPFRSVWFSRGGEYHAVLSSCRTLCEERGTFNLSQGVLKTTSRGGTVREQNVALSPLAPAAATGTARASRSINVRELAANDSSKMSAATAACTAGDGTEITDDSAKLDATDLSKDGTSDGSSGLIVANPSPLLEGCASSLLAGGVASLFESNGSSYARSSNKDVAQSVAQALIVKALGECLSELTDDWRGLRAGSTLDTDGASRCAVVTKEFSASIATALKDLSDTADATIKELRDVVSGKSALPDVTIPAYFGAPARKLTRKDCELFIESLEAMKADLSKPDATNQFANATKTFNRLAGGF